MMQTDLYPNLPGPVFMNLIDQRSPVDPRLEFLGELVAANGKRVWAGYGRNLIEIFEHAAAWWDNSNGRAGHTPDIRVNGLADPLAWSDIQRRVERAQSARMGVRK